MRHLLASRKATVSLEYALLGGIVIITVMVSFEIYGNALKFHMERTACQLAGRVWQEPAGPCT